MLNLVLSGTDLGDACLQNRWAEANSTMAGKTCQAMPWPSGGWAGRLTRSRQLQLQRPGWLQGAQDAWRGVGHPWSGCWAYACSLRPVPLAGW